MGGDTLHTTCCGEVKGPYRGLSEELAPSELQLSAALRQRNETDRLLTFRNEWVTRSDLSAIAKLGLGAVRVPFGVWVTSPHACPSMGAYVAGRGMGYLDDVIEGATEMNLSVLLDLHGACGSQNGAQSKCDGGSETARATCLKI